MLIDRVRQHVREWTHSYPAEAADLAKVSPFFRGSLFTAEQMIIDADNVARHFEVNADRFSRGVMTEVAPLAPLRGRQKCISRRDHWAIWH